MATFLPTVQTPLVGFSNMEVYEETFHYLQIYYYGFKSRAHSIMNPSDFMLQAQGLFVFCQQFCRLPPPHSL